MFYSRNILTIHNVCEKYELWLYNTLKFLKSYIGFIDPTKEDICGNNNGLLLTFDDGFKSNKVVTEKIINKLGIKAIFFITHDFIGLTKEEAHSFAQKNFFPLRKVTKSDGLISSMSWDDISFLASTGHIIGCHTFTHPNLKDLIEYKDKHQEIVKSGDVISKKLNLDVEYFAYPFGNINHIDRESIKIVRERYKFAFSNIRGFIPESKCNHLMFRQNIEPGCSIFKIILLLSGVVNIKYRQNRLRAFDLIRKSFYNEVL